MNIETVTVVIDDELFEQARTLPNVIVKSHNDCNDFVEIISEFDENDNIVAIYTKVSYANPIKSNLCTKEVYPNGF
jgi:hypothetical protein